MRDPVQHQDHMRQMKLKDNHIAILEAANKALMEELDAADYNIKSAEEGKHAVSLMLVVKDRKVKALLEAAREFFNKEMGGSAEAYAAKERLRRLVEKVDE